MDAVEGPRTILQCHHRPHRSALIPPSPPVTINWQKKESRELPYNDLRDWITRLDRAGELTTITVPVSPTLEMAEIADRTSKLPATTKRGPGGPALLFENVTGHPGARVLMNQFGSERRMKLALDVSSLDEIANRIRTLLHPPTPVSFLDKLKLLPTLAEVGSFFPKVIDQVFDALLQAGHPHRRRQVDLTKLPVLTTWPQDGGPFITLPCVITRDAASSGKRNVGMYRMQVYDKQTTGMHWQRQKNAAEQLRDRAPRLRIRRALPDRLTSWPSPQEAPPPPVPSPSLNQQDASPSIRG